MEFTEQEIKIVLAARKKVLFSTRLRILILSSMLFGIFLMVEGRVEAKPLSYGLMVAAFCSLAYPQFGWGPKYEDLVKILEEKTKFL